MPYPLNASAFSNYNDVGVLIVSGWVQIANMHTRDSQEIIHACNPAELFVTH